MGLAHWKILICVTLPLFTFFVDPVFPFGFDGGGADEDEDVVTTRHQILFIVDRTSQFPYMYENLAFAVGKISEYFRDDYPNTEVAIVSFGDNFSKTKNPPLSLVVAPTKNPAPDSSKLTCTQYQPLTRVSVNPVFWTYMEPEEEGDGLDEGDDDVVNPPPPPEDISKDHVNIPATVTRDPCYTMEQKFTKNKQNIANALNRIPIELDPRGYEANELSLTAIWVAVHDENLGWAKASKDPDGIDVNKVIVLVTDSGNDFFRVYNKGEHTKRQKRFIFKEPDAGPDNCQYMNQAKIKTVSKVLFDKMISIVAAVPRRPFWAISPIKPFVILFERFVGVPSDIVEFNPASQEEMVEAVGKSVERMKHQRPAYEVTVDDDGRHHHAAKLQVAFLLDRASVFKKSFFEKFGTHSQGFMIDLQMKFKEAQFAVAVFSDYTSNQWDHKIDGIFSQFDDSTSCYYVQQNFTNDTGLVAKAIQSIQREENVGGDLDSNQLSAILLLALDSQIGWKASDEKKKGGAEEGEEEGGEEDEGKGEEPEEKVTTDTSETKETEEVETYKIIVLITDSAPHPNFLDVNETGGFIDWENRRPAKGDGSDNCDNSFLPPISVVASAIEDKGIRMVTVVGQGRDPNIVSKYLYLYNKMSTPYTLSTSNTAQPTLIVEAITKGLPNVLPIPVISTKKDESTDEENPSSSSPVDDLLTTTEGEDIEEVTEEVFPVTDAPPIFESTTVKPIKIDEMDPEDFDAMLKTHYGLPTCDPKEPTCLDPDEDDEWDPPGYNTLGL